MMETTKTDVVNQLSKTEILEFVTEAIRDQLFNMWSLAELEESEEESNMTWGEVREWVKKHRWTPPKGAKSSLELLREDRDE